MGHQQHALQRWRWRYKVKGPGVPLLVKLTARSFNFLEVKENRVLKIFLIYKTNMLDVFCLALWSHSVYFSALGSIPWKLGCMNWISILLIFGFWLVWADGVTGKRIISKKNSIPMGIMLLAVCLPWGSQDFPGAHSQGLVILPLVILDARVAVTLHYYQLHGNAHILPISL